MCRQLADFLQRWLSLIVEGVKRAPPKGFESLRLGEGLNVEELPTNSEMKPATGFGCDNCTRKVYELEVWRAVKALTDMYIYGGNVSIAEKFQRLL